jgi:protein-disulfide isomerase
LFRNQARWDPEFTTDVRPGLTELGHEAGMSTEQVDKCIADKAQADRINQVAQDAVTRYNISGTPTFVINGVVQPSGEIAWPSLQQTLDSYLSKK